MKYYNTKRINVKLKGLAPMEYRNQALQSHLTEMSNYWGQFFLRIALATASV
ncbi:TPA: IS3 family transposase [Photobacterium damselae]